MKAGFKYNSSHFETFLSPVIRDGMASCVCSITKKNRTLVNNSCHWARYIVPIINSIYHFEIVSANVTFVFTWLIITNVYLVVEQSDWSIGAESYNQILQLQPTVLLLLLNGLNLIPTKQGNNISKDTLTRMNLQQAHIKPGRCHKYNLDHVSVSQLGVYGISNVSLSRDPFTSVGNAGYNSLFRGSVLIKWFLITKDITQT